MRIGIDASNLRRGGGVTHLLELLAASDPARDGFTSITVWGGKATLGAVPARPWIDAVHCPLLDGALPSRLYWQRTQLDRLAARDADLLFVPGGSYLGAFRPVVTMSQNLLPFDDAARAYGWSAMRLRFFLLRQVQSRTFRSASGVIFLTRTARDIVERRTGRLPGLTTIIPHGIARRFFHEPRAQRPLSDYSERHPFRLLYLSIVDLYKHQWHVAEAVAELRRSGVPVTLDLVGPAYPPALARLKATLERVDPSGEFIHYLGPIPYAELEAWYHAADAFIFASGCENLPNTLLEGMASGLPIACSDRGVMPEVLGDAGVYFDPESPASIAQAVRGLLENAPDRARLARAAFERAGEHTWEGCAHDTFAFLRQVYGAASGAPPLSLTEVAPS